MSEQNVEAIRSVYERWGEGDFRDTELFDPYVVLVLAADFPDPGPYLGREEVTKYMRGFLEPWSRLTIEAEEITAAGDSVVVGVLQRAAGAGSGAPTELRYFQVWSFRGGKVIRLENLRGRSEALEAAGVRSG
jgi:ketosteroid isomerase-like protein